MAEPGGLFGGGVQANPHAESSRQVGKPLGVTTR